MLTVRLANNSSLFLTQALAEAKLQEKVAELQKLEIDAVALKRQIAAMEAREAAKAKKGGRADEPKASRVVPVVKTQVGVQLTLFTVLCDVWRLYLS